MNAKYLLPIFFCCITATAQAQKSSENSDSAVNNGQPFQQIMDQIDQNRALIAANQSSVESLQLKVVEINSEISATQELLYQLADTIITQEGSLSSLRADINAVGLEQTLLSNGLANSVLDLEIRIAQLRIEFEYELEVFDATLFDVSNEIMVFKLDLQILVGTLNAQITTLRFSLDERSLAMDSLLLELTASTAQAMSAFLNIDVLEAMLAELITRTSAYGEAITELSFQVIVLGGSGVSTIDPIINEQAYSFPALDLVLVESNENDIPDNTVLIEYLSSFTELSSTTYLSILGEHASNGSTVQLCIANASRFLSWLTNGDSLNKEAIDSTASYARTTGNEWSPINSLLFWSNSQFFFLKALTSIGATAELGIYTSRAAADELYVSGNSLGNRLVFRLSNTIQSACGISP